MKTSKQLQRLEVTVREQGSLIEQLIRLNPVQVKWVPAKRAAELYGVSSRTLYNWRVHGLVEHKTINGQLFYSINPLMD